MRSQNWEKNVQTLCNAVFEATSLVLLISKGIVTIFENTFQFFCSISKRTVILFADTFPFLNQVPERLMLFKNSFQFLLNFQKDRDAFWEYFLVFTQFWEQL